MASECNIDLPCYNHQWFMFHCNSDKYVGPMHPHIQHVNVTWLPTFLEWWGMAR